MTESTTIWTVGHSNRSQEELVDLLTLHHIRLLADVRRFPGSRRHPHFRREPLAEALRAAGVEYRHFEALGGRRHKRSNDSPNRGWRVEGFNAYADYMQTAPFQTALEELIQLAAEQHAAIMCAEAVPWRCHRRLISDALTARGVKVIDILGPRQTRPHTMPDFAQVSGPTVTYPEARLFD